ncbi:hypothetical protein TWF281_002850 [Arthrobotrys megalospora]
MHTSEASEPTLPYDVAEYLAPPPGGYPPQQPGPGEPGFTPPDPNPITLESHIGYLKLAMRLKENECQIKNILAVINDLEQKGTAARYYQDGQPIELAQYDAAKGPIWVEHMNHLQLASSAVFPHNAIGNMS